MTDELAGLLVYRSQVRPEEHTGKITEILCPPDRSELFTRLVLEALELLREAGADHATFYSACRVQQEILSRLGFSSVDSIPATRVVIHKYHPDDEDPLLSPGARWFLSEADGDADLR